MQLSRQQVRLFSAHSCCFPELSPAQVSSFKCCWVTVTRSPGICGIFQISHKSVSAHSARSRRTRVYFPCNKILMKIYHRGENHHLITVLAAGCCPGDRRLDTRINVWRCVNFGPSQAAREPAGAKINLISQKGFFCNFLCFNQQGNCRVSKMHRSA